MVCNAHCLGMSLLGKVGALYKVPCSMSLLVEVLLRSKGLWGSKGPCHLALEGHLCLKVASTLDTDQV